MKTKTANKLDIKIPKTTPNKPYIEFRIDNKGKIKLRATSNWWGGKCHGFHCSDGSDGNTCLPKDLNSYIEALKKRKVKAIEKEILTLQKRLEQVKHVTESWHF